MIERRDVFGTIADHRHPLFGQRGQNQFAVGSVGDGFEGFGIENFGIKMILVDVHPAFLAALARNAGSDDLAEPVIVIGENIEFSRDFAVHFLGAGFGAEQSQSQLEIFDVVTQFFDHFADIQGIRRRADQYGRLQIFQKHHLTLGVAGTGGNDGGTQAFAPLMHPECARKQTVPERNLYDIAFAYPCRRGKARTALGPDFHILFGITHDGRLSACSAGSMDAHQILFLGGDQTVRIIVPEVALDRKRNPADVVQGADAVGIEARFVVLLFVKRDVVVCVTHDMTQAFQL